ncbi:MAG: hypothetical protein HY319_09560 [Armatimonadetes bacterium]|nr:hypothetical protein [Armatimonadota bacterium]
MIHTLLTPLLRLFRTLPAPPRTPVREPPVVEDLIRLERILLLFARRQNSFEWFRLMTDQMSPDCIMFKTPEHLKIDQPLLVQLLLNHGRSLEVPARVNWVMETGGGMAGQLDMQVPEAERGQVREFLLELRARA